MNDKLISQPAPHVRQSETVGTIMVDMIFALVPIYIMAFFYYGPRAFALGGLSTAICLLCSFACMLLLGNRPDMADLTPVVTGLIIPLMMPADIEYYIVAAADIVAVMVVKFPFGGTGENLFNPAAVGFASAALCWPEKIFSYPEVFSTLSVFGENEVRTAASASLSLANGMVPDQNIFEILLGNTPGPMGMTCTVVIFACGVYVIVKRAASWRVPFFFLTVYALLSMMFPRISATAVESAAYELFSGMIVFGGFFMLTEPVTGPKRDTAKSIYGGVSALIVFMFHRFGVFEDGFVFALIIMNVFAPYIDMACENTMHQIRNGKRNLSAETIDIRKAFSPRKKKGDEKA